jgi:hypothetical protein
MAEAIRTNKREYSKYTPGLDMVDLTVTGATIGTDYGIALVRDDGFGDVIVHLETAADERFDLLLDLRGDVVFEGELAATREGINYVRQGIYHAEIRDVAGALLARSNSFPISVITVEEFKRSYLFGVPLYAEEVMTVVNQPRTLAGVSVGYVDPAMLKGPGALAFVADDRTFTWRGGPLVAVVGEEVQALQLLTPEGDAYVEIEVDPFLLPAVDTSESLLIDNWRMADADVRRYLWQAYEWVQQQLHMRLETTITTTDPTGLGGYYDETAEAIGYSRGQSRTIEIGGPKTRPLRKVESLAGYYVATKTLEIPAEWITFEERGGTIELLPISGSAIVGQVAPVWSNLLPYGGARAGRREMQDFWHFRVVAGLRTLEGERYSIREAIAKRAALAVLGDLSLGATAGRTSRSSQREGVSESWSYGGQGAYGEKIMAYSDWLKISIPKIRQYFMGIEVVVL